MAAKMSLEAKCCPPVRIGTTCVPHAIARTMESFTAFMWNALILHAQWSSNHFLVVNAARDVLGARTNGATGTNMEINLARMAKIASVCLQDMSSATTLPRQAQAQAHAWPRHRHHHQCRLVHRWLLEHIQVPPLAPRSIVHCTCNSLPKMRPALSAVATMNMGCTHWVTLGSTTVRCAHAILHMQFTADLSSANSHRVPRRCSTSSQESAAPGAMVVETRMVIGTTLEKVGSLVVSHASARHRAKYLV